MRLRLPNQRQDSLTLRSTAPRLGVKARKPKGVGAPNQRPLFFCEHSSYSQAHCTLDSGRWSENMEHNPILSNGRLPFRRRVLSARLTLHA